MPRTTPPQGEPYDEDVNFFFSLLFNGFGVTKSRGEGIVEFTRSSKELFSYFCLPWESEKRVDGMVQEVESRRYYTDEQAYGETEEASLTVSECSEDDSISSRSGSNPSLNSSSVTYSSHPEDEFNREYGSWYDSDSLENLDNLYVRDGKPSSRGDMFNIIRQRREHVSSLYRLTPERNLFQYLEADLPTDVELKREKDSEVWRRGTPSSFDSSDGSDYELEAESDTKSVSDDSNTEVDWFADLYKDLNDKEQNAFDFVSLNRFEEPFRRRRDHVSMQNPSIIEGNPEHRLTTT